jgi:hypothetical protein
MLTREQILGAQDIRIEPVEVPEWGGVVYVKRMSCRAAEEYQDWLMARQNGDGSLKMADLRASLLARVLCDDQGRLLFSEDDIGALGEKDSAVMARLFQAAQKASGLVDDAVEETEKNS